ncbi:hypothetical protein ACE6H2_004663 [Prunus campanulata]
MVLHISIRRCQRIFLVRSCGSSFLAPISVYYPILSHLPPCANLSICLLLVMSFNAHTPSTLFFISSLNLLLKPVKL